MSKHQRLHKEVEARWPLLAQFLGGYLHEDWTFENETPQGAVEQAISAYPVEMRQQVRRELVDLLSRTDDDTRLRRMLNDGLGVNVYFREPSEARAFAEDVERSLLASIKAAFDPGLREEKRR